MLDERFSARKKLSGSLPTSEIPGKKSRAWFISIWLTLLFLCTFQGLKSSPQCEIRKLVSWSFFCFVLKLLMSLFWCFDYLFNCFHLPSPQSISSTHRHRARVKNRLKPDNLLNFSANIFHYWKKIVLIDDWVPHEAESRAERCGDSKQLR